MSKNKNGSNRSLSYSNSSQITSNSPRNIFINSPRNIFIIVAVIVLLFSSVLPGKQILIAASNFNDVKSTDWYYTNVNDLIKDSRSIIKGYPDGSFKPKAPLTKEQFITMVVRAAGFDLANGTVNWADNFIKKAYDLEFIFYGEFASFSDPITRQEMSLIIARVVDYLDGTQTYSQLEQVEQVVLDSASFKKAFKESILKTYQLGIINGYEDHTFRPEGILTRAEASAVIIRVIKPTSRIKFDYDAQYYKIFGDIKSHLIGGSNWVNPVTATPLKNAQEDWLIMKSDISYFPLKKDFDLGLNRDMSNDEIMGAIDYDKNGAFPGQIEDFENLLRRRISEKDIEKIMYYLDQKKSNTIYMEVAEVVFFVGDGKYLVRIYEEILNKGRKEEQAIDIQFNIIFRSQNFIDIYEKQILLVDDDHTMIILR